MKQRYKRPPRIAVWFLKRIAVPGEELSAIGDFEEEYQAIAQENGIARARFWCWLQVMISIPSFFKNSMYWSVQMFKNYLKAAWRNLKRHKGYSFINTAGLAIGMACTILILLWVQGELSHDRFHEKADDIYRVVEKWHYTSGRIGYNRVTPGPLAPVLKDNYPEIINSSRISYWNPILTCDEKSIFCRGGLVDTSFFEMFTFPFIRGNTKTALSNPQSIVITEELAKKFFGKDDPLGRVINDGDDDLKVTGVIKNIPENSHIRFDFLVSFEIAGDSRRYWGNNNTFTYVLLRPESSYKEVSKKIAGVIKEHIPKSGVVLYLQPLAQVHLFALEGGGLITYIYIFLTMAVVILLIACINFMNLSTARASKRFKEVGIKKVVGSNRMQLIKQFLSESILIAFGALVLAVILAELFLPVINNLPGIQLELSYSGSIILSLVGIAIITGIISGSYPAFFLSSFSPVNILKGTPISSSLTKGAGKGKLRRILVITQFSLSIIFIVCAMTVYDQLDYIKTRDLGYDKENTVILRLQGELEQKYEAVKNELLKNPDILNITATDRQPVMWRNSTDGVSWEGKDPTQAIDFGVRSVDPDYLETFKMELTQGRFFSKELSTDAMNYIVNEAAVKIMGYQNPLGKKFIFRRRIGEIIGVVKDFHTESLHYEIGPFMLYLDPDDWNYMSLRISSGNISATLYFLENKIKEFAPAYPFEYHFLDQDIDDLYKTEQLTCTIIQYITFLAIFISCLGLFALAAFSSEQRTKEIGIRKVLGASVPSLVYMLSTHFTKWVLVANVIAWPVAYFALNNWLQNFVYRVDISWLTFFLAGMLALAISLATVSYQAIRAATANPIEALRYE